MDSNGRLLSFHVYFFVLPSSALFQRSDRKPKGLRWGGGRSGFAFVGTTGSFVIPPAFFSVREPLLSFFLLFHRLTRAAVFPFPSFFSHVSPFFFTLLYSWNARRASWQLTAAAEFDRSFMDLGRSYRLLSVKRFAIIRCNCDRFSLVQWDRFLEPLQARSVRCLLCFCTNHDRLLPIGLLRWLHIEFVSRMLHAGFT